MQLTYSEWIAKVSATLAESKIMLREDELEEVWQERYATGMRPSKAAAIAIDEYLAVLKFKHV